jgi:hypothetical protein
MFTRAWMILSAYLKSGLKGRRLDGEYSTGIDYWRCSTAIGCPHPSKASAHIASSIAVTVTYLRFLLPASTTVSRNEVGPVNRPMAAVNARYTAFAKNIGDFNRTKGSIFSIDFDVIC